MPVRGNPQCLNFEKYLICVFESQFWLQIGRLPSEGMPVSRGHCGGLEAVL